MDLSHDDKLREKLQLMEGRGASKGFAGNRVERVISQFNNGKTAVWIDALIAYGKSINFND